MSTSFHDSMWATASRDDEAIRAERAVALASVGLSALTPFLHQASSEAEYDQRLSLVADRATEVMEAHTTDTLAHQAALAQCREDFLTLNQGRVAARLEAAMLATAGLGERASCKTCDMDIEDSGGGDWRDRGGNSYCDTSGASKYDSKGEPRELPHAKHQPYRTAAKTAGGDGKGTCGTCGQPISQQDYAWYHHTNEDKAAQSGHQPHPSPHKESSRKTAGISLTNVGIVDKAGLVCKGKDSSGKEVKFKVTKSEMDQLSSVLYGDLAINFSGVTIEKSDIIDGSKTAAADPKCPDCNGSGAVPAQGHEDADDVDNGQVACPTCKGSGTASGHTGSRHPFGREASMTFLADLSDEEFLEAEAILAGASLHAAAAENGYEDGYDTGYGEQPYISLDQLLSARGKPGTRASDSDDFWKGIADGWNDAAAGHPAKHVLPIDVRTRYAKKTSMVRTATVKCAKCTAGNTPDGQACGYCDGAGALDPTMAMVKAADGWDQGITAESFFKAAAGTSEDVLKTIQNRDPDGGSSSQPTAADYDSFEKWVKSTYGEDAWKDYNGNWGHQPGDEPKHVESAADGTAQYGDNPRPPGKPGWVHDEWDEGKADKATLDEGRAGKDRGLPKGMDDTEHKRTDTPIVEQASLDKTADVAALMRRIQGLAGHLVTMDFTSDWGVSHAAGMLSFNDGNAQVTSKSGAVVSVPAYNVLAVEATGYSDADPAAGMHDREPGILDWMGSAVGNGLIPSGVTGSLRTQANPYADNPYQVNGPGNPTHAPAGMPQGDETPRTTRPRVAPNDAGAAPEVGYNPEKFPTENGEVHPGPVDRSADSVEVGPAGETVARLAQIEQARREFSGRPTPAMRRSAKVAAITASVLTSNPGMEIDSARKIAETTVARFSGVSAT